MRKTAKWLTGIMAAIVIVSVCAFAFFVIRIAPIGSAYKAKRICSCIFLAGRDPGQVVREDVAGLEYIGYEIDFTNRKVTGNFLGMAKRTAIYREGLGCTLVLGRTADELYRQAAGFRPVVVADLSQVQWPDGDMLPDDGIPAIVDRKKIDEAVDWAFNDANPEKPKNTRAVIIVYDGRIIAERYAAGFDMHTRQLGWSMTKSVTNALLAVLVRQGRLHLTEKAPVPEWRDGKDPRNAITIDELIRMSSGLEFGEDYVWPLSDAIQMLFNSDCSGCFAARKPLKAKPDIEWQYSSGTTNILSRIVRQASGGTDAEFFSFPQRELFSRIGVQSAVMEPDPDGVFVGSSFMYATPRDWARLGLLFINDGVWNGVRIFPDGWVRYSTTPTPMAPDGKYGAHLWLNAGPKGFPTKRLMPHVPEDMFSFEGFEGQEVAVIPSHKLVVVRMGMTWDHESWGYDEKDYFLRSIVSAVAGRGAEKG